MCRWWSALILVSVGDALTPADDVAIGGDGAYIFNRCPGPVPAYAAAWFAHVDAVLTTPFKDSLGMEYHDYNMYNVRPHLVLKSKRFDDFFVDHLSTYEHLLRKQRKVDIATVERRVSEQAAQAVAESCGPLRLSDPAARAAFEERVLLNTSQPLAVIPFYGGEPEVNAETGKQMGNAHSVVSRDAKAAQTKAVLCSVMHHLEARVVVGVCNTADRAAIEALGLPLLEVAQLDCGHGAYLAFRLLSEVQRRVKAGDAKWKTTHVYFSEVLL